MYRDEMIVRRVPKEIRRRVRQNMDRYCMGLYDAFKSAVSTSHAGDRNLRNAWDKDDFRLYIPSAYLPQYLDFEKYPLKY